MMYRKLHFLISFVLLMSIAGMTDGQEETKKKEEPETISYVESCEEVSRLKNIIRKVTDLLKAERIWALDKAGQEYGNLKDRLRQPIPPKSQFESAADFEARTNKRKEELSGCEQQYETNRAEIGNEYEDKIRTRTQAYQDKINILKNKRYTVAGIKVVLLDYNAEDQAYKIRLSAFHVYESKWIYYLSIDQQGALGLYQRRDQLKAEAYYSSWNNIHSLVNIVVTDPVLGRLSRIGLRPSYEILSHVDVESLIKQRGFFDKYLNKEGSLDNKFRKEIISENTVVIDDATGLMWHQSGSSTYLKFNDAENWVSELNQGGYAGYTDWRLPTMDEAASLLEADQENGKLYIDPVFSEKQEWIWTGDKYSDKHAWVVKFYHGDVFWDRMNARSYVRPVRRK